MFRLFAELIAFHLEANSQLDAVATRLAEEQRASESRERFIAMLGHDLRNPLASIDAGARLLLKTPLEPKARNIVGLVQASVWRMAALVDNVLDFARGRQGGLSVAKRPSQLEPALRHVVAELQSVHPRQPIEMAIDLHHPVDCDEGRISQLLSNLLGNALTHGAPGGVVQVRASSANGALELSVGNHGEHIPEAAMARLFQPFERGAVRPNQEGLGLGLYIASEIAKAHGGALTVASSDEETVFTFRMPTSAE